MSLDRPVLVTGTPRSGKTCVHDILVGSGEFACGDEPLLLWEAGKAAKGDDCLGPQDATDRVRRGILSRCEKVMRNYPGKRYADNLAYHALRIPFVHRVMPEAKIVHVIRSAETAVPEMLYGWTFRFSIMRVAAERARWGNWRAAPRLVLRFARNFLHQRLSGARATWGPRVPQLEEFRRGHSVAEVAAYQWLNMVRIARRDMATLPPGRGLEVRYEDLRRDPRGQGQRLAEFCEVRDPQAVAAFAARYINPQFVNEYRVPPTPQEWSAIRELVGELQRELGYWT